MTRISKNAIRCHVSCQMSMRTSNDHNNATTTGFKQFCPSSIRTHHKGWKRCSETQAMVFDLCQTSLVRLNFGWRLGSFLQAATLYSSINILVCSQFHVIKHTLMCFSHRFRYFFYPPFPAWRVICSNIESTILIPFSPALLVFRGHHVFVLLSLHNTSSATRYSPSSPSTI